MDNRKYLEDQAKIQAISCIQEGDFVGLKCILEKVGCHNESIIVENQVHVSGFDYNDEPVYQTYYNNELCKISEPVLNIKIHGAALLREAVERRRADIVIYLLDAKQKRSVESLVWSSYYVTSDTFSITLTPKIMKSLLDIILMNKVSKTGFYIDTSSRIDPIVAVSHAEFDIKNAEILMLLSIKFVNDNVKNKKLMIGFIGNVERYLVNQPAALEAMVIDCLLTVILGKDNELFSKMMSIRISKGVINQNQKLQQLMTTPMKIMHNPCMLEDEQILNCNKFFCGTNQTLLDQISYILTGAEAAFWTFNKFKRVSIMQNVSNKANQMNSDLTPLEKFRAIVNLLVSARNKIACTVGDSKFMSELGVMDNIDHLLGEIFKAPLIKEIFSLEVELHDEYTIKKLYVDGDQYMLHNTSLLRLGDENKLETKPGMS